ncbi:pentapeptide repeat-containing protein [Nostoc linckia FACHB-391]|uniref:Pentapeptide repeat-containing protein n=2 Tax=Nostoc TaxID=1177 RepID=A0ABR8IAS3_9NOSO|nr:MULTISPECIES: pentapeptide repeat-containing protein [Nostoc]MBD2562133.1 pentapeptide repeat-containing protein [Nostoc linckia FACHB-391]MBD2647535.1 pentapeptide repeat-containing protein [Nostoc foliaceum FACHB-393]
MPQDFSSQNLRGCSFKGQNLAGANFSYADIGVDLARVSASQTLLTSGLV